MTDVTHTRNPFRRWMFQKLGFHPRLPVKTDQENLYFREQLNAFRVLRFGPGVVRADGINFTAMAKGWNRRSASIKSTAVAATYRPKTAAHLSSATTPSTSRAPTAPSQCSRPGKTIASWGRRCRATPTGRAPGSCRRPLPRCRYRQYRQRQRQRQRQRKGGARRHRRRRRRRRRRHRRRHQHQLPRRRREKEREGRRQQQPGHLHRHRHGLRRWPSPPTWHLPHVSCTLRRWRPAISTWRMRRPSLPKLAGPRVSLPSSGWVARWVSRRWLEGAAWDWSGRQRGRSSGGGSR